MNKKIKISKRREKKKIKPPVEVEQELEKPVEIEHKPVVEQEEVIEEVMQEVVEEVVETIEEVPHEPENKTTTKGAIQKQNNGKNKLKLLLISTVILLSLSTITFAYLYFSQSQDNSSLAANSGSDTTTENSTDENTDGEKIVRVDVISKSMGFAEFLSDNGIPDVDIDILRKGADRLAWNYLEVGDRVKYHYNYNISDDNIEYIIYEPKEKPEVYYKMVVKDSLWLSSFQKEVEIKTQVAALIIEETLIETVLNNGLRYDLLDQMEKALIWSIDFYDLKPGDRFKVIYDEKFIGGKSAEITALRAIYFKKQDEDDEYYGFLFDVGDRTVFFDEQGSEMKKAFLKAPLKYGRLTSGYSLERVHPVTGEKRPHFGTDYAAPEGTPIVSVGNGVVLEAMFKSNNGNYVKIQHDLKKYKTQYLHMSRFGEGIAPGKRVKQGQVIGYVGTTGLSTGPHVCFRFWKNDRQVDHRKENVSDAQILPKQYQQDFQSLRDDLKKQLRQAYF